METYDNFETITAIKDSSDATKSSDLDKEAYSKATDLELPPATVSHITYVHVLSVSWLLVIALFSNGYNAQIIGYMEPLFSDP
jgi:hypothetical protein